MGAGGCPLTAASYSSVVPLGTAYHLPPRESISLNSQSPYGSLQHGYHRLTGFSGRTRSPTNPVRWSNSSFFATSAGGGTMSGSFLRKELPDRAEDRSESQIANLKSLKHPLLVLRTTFLHGKASHTILRSLALPYSTAITDSLDSQVASAPLRIRFAGVTHVRLPPRKRWRNI